MTKMFSGEPWLFGPKLLAQQEAKALKKGQKSDKSTNRKKAVRG